MVVIVLVAFPIFMSDRSLGSTISCVTSELLMWWTMLFAVAVAANGAFVEPIGHVRGVYSLPRYWMLLIIEVMTSQAIWSKYHVKSIPVNVSDSHNVSLMWSWDSNTVAVGNWNRLFFLALHIILYALLLMYTFICSSYPTFGGTLTISGLSLDCQWTVDGLFLD